MSVERSHIALILAGGPARPELSPGHPIPKALLPVASRPLVARAATALARAGCSSILVLHDAGDPLHEALEGIPGVICVPRSGRDREYAAGIRFGLRSIVERIPADILDRASILAISCDLALADSDDFGTLLSAFDSSGLDVAMGLGDAGSAAVHLPDRRLSIIRLRDEPERVVQTVVTLRGALLRADPAGFRFADWSVPEMDRVENLLRAARQKRATPRAIPLLVYREVIRRIDSPSSLLRLLRAIILFALGRLDCRTAVGVVTDLSRIRFGVLRNDRWRLSFDVDSEADLRFAESFLASRSYDTATCPPITYSANTGSS